MAVIRVRGLRKEYGPTVALDGIDLDVPEGGVFGFVGPNGAGKTTTIRCLLGLVRPTAGTCSVLGAEVPRRYHQVQRRVGSLIETHALFPGFSGRRNLSHLARLYRLPAARVDVALEQVGLTPRADDEVRTYSLGMRQRLGIAAALLKDPELLVLDEPANGLDPEGIADVRRLLRRLGDEGRTVFLSSHQLAEVQQTCDRVAVIARGRCVAAGDLDAVLAAGRRGGMTVRITDASRAREVLASAGIAAEIAGRDLLIADVEDGSLVAKALADASLYPSELRGRAATLEDAYLELIQGDGA